MHGDTSELQPASSLVRLPSGTRAPRGCARACEQGCCQLQFRRIRQVVGLGRLKSATSRRGRLIYPYRVGLGDRLASLKGGRDHPRFVGWRIPAAKIDEALLFHFNSRPHPRVDTALEEVRAGAQSFDPQALTRLQKRTGDRRVGGPTRAFWHRSQA
jgi:hypothetical protein